MNEGSWERLESDLAELEDAGPAERERRLADLERADPERARMLRRMLAPDALPPSFLAPVVEAGDEGPSAAAAGVLPGTRIGPYRLVRRIGAGGMGAVFEAEQESPRRTVAVKVLQLGAASPDALRRFRYESELLARLQHPSIAQVLESGTHRAEWGGGGFELPWYAMEHVPGARDLITYADEERLDRRARVELACRFCAAVHHGHQRGVLHRDLKPSNLLVDAEGRPKVIDFGVARALERDGGDASWATRTGDVVGTLAYMSPEQLSGDSAVVDVRSDVYSLGVVLFQLLTGRTPHRLADVPLHRAIEIVSRAPAPRPSSLDTTVPAELDWIVLQALEHDLERRYGSAEELARDLRRFLAHEPVTAGAPSAVYRARKFVRRNRIAVAAGAVVAAALIAGAAFANLGRLRAERAAGEASVEARKASDANRILSDLLSAPSVRLYGRDARVVDLLDAARARLADDDSSDPAVRANVQRALGTAYLGLGLYPEAEEALADAFAVERARLGDDDPLVLELAAGLFDARRWLGRRDEVDAPLTEAYARADGLLGPDHAATNELRRALASLRSDQRRFDEAIELMRATIASRERGGRYDERARFSDLDRLATILLEAGDVDEAEAVAREAHAGLLAAYGADDGSTLMAEGNLGALLLRTGRLPEAAETLRDVAERMRAALGEDHLVRLQVLQELANAERMLGDTGDAIATYRALVDGHRARYGEFGEVTLGAKLGLGAALLEAGELGRAEAELRDVEAHGAELLGDDARIVLTARANLATVSRARGEHAAADELELGLIDAFLRAQDTDSAAAVANNLSLQWMSAARLEDAEALLDELLPKLRARPPAEPKWLGQLLGVQARCLVGLERFEDAEPIAIEAHAGLLELWGAAHPGVRYQAATLASLLERQGRDDEAELWRARAAAE